MSVGQHYGPSYSPHTVFRQLRAGNIHRYVLSGCWHTPFHVLQFHHVHHDCRMDKYFRHIVRTSAPKSIAVAYNIRMSEWWQEWNELNTEGVTNLLNCSAYIFLVKSAYSKCVFIRKPSFLSTTSTGRAHRHGTTGQPRSYQFLGRHFRGTCS